MTRRSVPVLVPLLVVGSLALAACAPAPPDAPAPPRIGLYGDSIGLQASPWFEQSVTAAGRIPMGGSFPGAAACDVAEWVLTDLSGPTPPDAVAVTVVGNFFTPCMELSEGVLATPDTPEFLELYREAITSIADETLAAGVPFLFAWGPPSAGPGDDEWVEQLPIRDLAQEISLTHPNMQLVDAGAAVTPVGGGYAVDLPCLPDEAVARGCADGQIQIRFSVTDGHFACRESQMSNGWPRPCPVYSSGARRYGEALAVAANMALDDQSRGPTGPAHPPGS